MAQSGVVVVGDWGFSAPYMVTLLAGRGDPRASAPLLVSYMPTHARRVYTQQVEMLPEHPKTLALHPSTLNS